MNRTMLAFRIVAWERPPEVVEVDVPRPGPGELVVKVAGNGLCHSDVTMMTMPGSLGEAIGWRVPFTLGHEVGGWIAEIGAGVEGLEPGDPVAVISPHSCGRCGVCLRGQDNLCDEGVVGRGYGRDGGLAEYVLVGSSREVVRLHHLDPKEAAPLTDAGATSYHGVRRVLPKLRADSSALVIGAGGLGAFAIQLLRALSPARVIAVDTNPARLEVALAMGAHEVVAGVDRSTRAALGDLTGGAKLDAVLDLVGSDETIRAGIGALAKGGSFALIGAAGGSFAKPWYHALPMDAEIFTYQGSTIADAHEVLALADEGRIRSEVDLFSFEQIAEAYAALEAGTLRGRAVVTPLG